MTPRQVHDPSHTLLHRRYIAKLHRQGDAVLAVVRRAVKHAAGPVDLYRLEAAKRLIRPGHAMTARDQIVRNRARYRRLQRQRAVEGKAARRVGGLLDIKTAVEHAA